jgi:hypothetical protein
MESHESNWVAKVHPATRPVEPDDPMTLHATAVAGDPEVMLECLVQEFAGLGWDAEGIVGLFREPCYPALYDLWRLYGEEGVRTRVHGVLSALGIFHVQATECAEPEPVPAEPELIALGLPASWDRPEGDSHASGL